MPGPAVVSLFSGCGGMDLGFKKAGYDILASNDVHPTICDTLESNFKHHIIHDSVHTLSVEHVRRSYGDLDLIIGAFPCPIYSTASDIHGTRVGVRHKGNPYMRYASLGGDLFLHFWRFPAGLQPGGFVVENVEGVKDAQIVRETLKNTPCNGSTLGYYCTLYDDILEAVDFGLPQARKRFFHIAVRNTKNPISRSEMHQRLLAEGAKLPRRRLVVGDILEKDPELPWEPESMVLPATGEKVTAYLPDYAKRRLAGITCRDGPIITQAGPDAVAPTVVAHYAKDRGTRLIKIGDTVRPYTWRECARLQGIPDTFSISGSEYMQYVQIGNAVPVPVAKAIGKVLREVAV